MRAARPSPLVLLLVLLLGRAAAAPPAVVARVTIGCGVASTLAWSRRLCFEKYAAVSYPTPRSLSVTLSLEVTLLPAPGAAASANATPAPGPCGDTIRLQFWGATGLAAPPASLAVPHPSGACGLYTATLLLPSLDATAAGAHAATYAPEARVVHCAGEGLLDPPTPRPHPARLADFSDGPAVWNARAMFAPGAALHIVLRRGGGGAAGLLAAPPPPPALPPPLSWGVAKLGSAAAVPRAMPGVKGSAAGPARLRPGLPPCLGGDAPGVWVPHTSLYPDHPGDPVQWRPHDCVYRRFSGPRLDGCLNRTRGPVLVLGESTLRQAELLMRLHIADGSAHWPRAMRHETFPPAHPNMEAIEAHGAAVLLSEGLPWLAARGGGGGGPAGGPGGRRRRRPHAIVVLQGANDAARDAAGATHARLLQFLDALAAMVANGTVLAPTVPLVWVTAPVRHYVSGPGPGQVECLDDAPRLDCAATKALDWANDGAGGLAWGASGLRGGQGEWLRSFGTLPRRAAYNARAVAAVRARFPGAHVVDFEALTAPLPVDYTHDGEHWVSTYSVYRWYKGSPYQGRSLGGAELANVLANVICPAELAGAAVWEGGRSVLEAPEAAGAGEGAAGRVPR